MAGTKRGGGALGTKARAATWAETTRAWKTEARAFVADAKGRHALRRHLAAALRKAGVDLSSLARAGAELHARAEATRAELAKARQQYGKRGGRR